MPYFNMYRFWRIFLLLCIPACAMAQFNVKIGYGLGFAQANNNNAILSAFNANAMGPDGAVDFEVEMPELRSLYGIALGIRYKLTPSNAFELSWENLSRSRETFGIYESSNQLYIEELSYSFNQFYFSYQSQFGNIGLGSSVGLNRVRIKRQIDGSSRSFTLVPDSQYFARFNLSYTIESSRSVALSIQPYYQIPLSSINIEPLAAYLNVSGQNNSESFSMFGINLLFYNGRQ